MISAERLSSERKRHEQSARPDKWFYAEVMRELEAARARIVILEDALGLAGRMLDKVRAPGLSQEQREACLAGADALTSTHPAWSPQQQQAAILRRLGGQRT